jgi:hypothetical protein
MTTPGVRPASRDLLGFEQFGVRLDDADLEDLRRGRVVVKMLEPRRDSELAVFAASRIDVSPRRFVEALQHSATLWRGTKVPRTGTFSSPPQVSDIATMRLPAEDIDALRRCRPGDCEVKLATAEMARVRAAIAANPGDWRSSAQAAFRALILARMRRYSERGLAGLQTFNDHRELVTPSVAFSQLTAGSEGSAGAVRPLVDYFSRYPVAPVRPRAEHMYWLEVVDSPKPTIQAAHMVIDRCTGGSAIEVVAASRQIFATHYVNASLTVTALVRGPTGERFMVYVNRSSVDGLGGFLSGVKRVFIRGRVRRAARAAVEHLKRRIETFDGSIVASASPVRWHHNCSGAQDDIEDGHSERPLHSQGDRMGDRAGDPVHRDRDRRPDLAFRVVGGGRADAAPRHRAAPAASRSRLTFGAR